MATPSNCFSRPLGMYVWIVVARGLVLNLGPQLKTIWDVQTRSYEY